MDEARDHVGMAIPNLVAPTVDSGTDIGITHTYTCPPQVLSVQDDEHTSVVSELSNPPVFRNLPESAPWPHIIDSNDANLPSQTLEPVVESMETEVNPKDNAPALAIASGHSCFSDATEEIKIIPTMGANQPSESPTQELESTGINHVALGQASLRDHQTSPHDIESSIDSLSVPLLEVNGCRREEANEGVSNNGYEFDTSWISTITSSWNSPLAVLRRAPWK